MYCIFGDLHGDMEILDRFVSYITKRRDVDRLFFTGDFFGMKEDVGDITKERNRQYRKIENMLRQVRVPIHAVPGNYDCRFDKYFQRYNCHHVLFGLEGKLCFGHGGSYHPPTDIVNKNVSVEFVGQNVEHEYMNLMSIRPEIVLSHNPIRRYNYDFLEKDLGDSLYISGHNHSPTFIDVQHKSSHVRVIKPGAIGRTMNNATGEPLPKTFMIYDTGKPDSVELVSIEDDSFNSKKLQAGVRSLQEYRDSEGRWLKEQHTK